MWMEIRISSMRFTALLVGLWLRKVYPMAIMLRNYSMMAARLESCMTGTLSMSMALALLSSPLSLRSITPNRILRTEAGPLRFRLRWPIASLKWSRLSISTLLLRRWVLGVPLIEALRSPVMFGMIRFSPMLQTPSAVSLSGRLRLARIRMVKCLLPVSS